MTLTPAEIESLRIAIAAALERFNTAELRTEFQYRLYQQCEVSEIEVWQLTPLDWCIAFARTAKIWRYKI